MLNKNNIHEVCFALNGERKLNFVVIFKVVEEEDFCRKNDVNVILSYKN